MNRLILASVIFINLSIIPLAFADAPVEAGFPVNNSNIDATENSTPVLSLEQRVNKLEQQFSAINQINLLNQVNDLTQRMQDLQGKVEELTHNLQKLQDQVNTQYADVDQRLQQKDSNKKSADISSKTIEQSLTASKKQSSTDDSSLNTELTSSEQTAYQLAYNKIKSKDYAGAVTAIKAFLGKYPNGHYAPNAHYWLGELYLLQGKATLAAVEFTTLIAKYPDHAKYADANLKLGYAYLLQNDVSKAKIQFKKVVQQFPNTPAAKSAQSRLHDLA